MKINRIMVICVVLSIPAALVYQFFNFIGIVWRSGWKPAKSVASVRAKEFFAQIKKEWSK